MRATRAGLALFLLACAAGPLRAQSAGDTTAGPLLAVGGPGMETSRIRPRSDTLVLMIAREDQELAVGTLVLRTRLVGAGADSTVVRMEVARDLEGTVLETDSFTVARRSLAPVREHYSMPGRTGQLSFEGRRVVGSRTVRGVETPIDVVLDAPAFYENSLDLVLAALPLREGYAVQLPVFDSDQGGVVRLRVRVAGAEQARTADGGQCSAWRVEVDGGDSRGTYWIERSGLGVVRYHPRTETDGVRMVRTSGCTRAT
jgi:hypothetical protein